MRYIVLDLATTAIDGADRFLEPVSAPSNYKDPEKIAAYVAERQAEQRERLALDLDLARISCFGWTTDTPGFPLTIKSCKTEDEEEQHLGWLAHLIMERDRPALVSFNGLKFDWPILMRRALYLGVKLHINLDRYRTPHHDLYDHLTHHGLVGGHGLSWYAKRLGWDDLVKPLTGAEEAAAPATGHWAELEASVRHDVEATLRLARWLRVMPESER